MPTADLGSYFTTRAALQAGVSSARLRGGEWEAPFAGVRSVPDASAEVDADLGDREREHLHRARALAARVDGSAYFYTHVTAAVAWRIPLPPFLVDRAKIDLGVFTPMRLPRMAGVNGHEVRPKLATVVTDTRTGLRVTSPASTWAMLASVLRHPYDVVAAGDAAARVWRVEQPLAALAQLEAAARAGRRVGVGRLRDALPRIRSGSASRPETWMRLLTVDAGLPEPLLNYDVIDAGARLACVDMAYPMWKIAVEYEGQHHRTDPDQWARDIRRYEALEAAGWIVVRVTKDEVFKTPEVFTSRLRRAVARRR